MQEDKEAVFGAFDTLELCLAAMTGMVADMKPDAARMKASASAGFTTATDLADWVTQKLNIPFREAHHITGRIVKLAEGKGCDLAELSLADMQAAEPRITQDIFNVLTVEASAASRTSFGGTAPANVRAQVEAARKRFLGSAP
jgi:argininosuccinate lyase